MSCSIINNIPNIENYTYLELGVFDNKNFNSINCKEKFSVDVNGNALFTGTTDQYFSSIDKSKRFDIIFIDANHDYEFVLRDFNNSINHANKWVILHDMIPPALKYTRSKFCSDSFRLLMYLIKETKFEIYSMNNNFGLTFVRMPTENINPPNSYSNISYYEFVEFINNVKLYSDEEIINILRKENV
jgi:hypothetical protein